MRPTALESLYRDLESKYGYQERTLPANFIIRPLNEDDLDQLVKAEEVCFPPEERASAEKLKYRLEACPELMAGIFRRTYDWKTQAPDVAGISSGASSLDKEELVGYIQATKMESAAEIDAAMELGGHKETGRVIAIHGVGVVPDQRKQGLAHVMLKDYVQRLFSMHTADGIAIIAHKELIPMYEKIGFQDKGKSKSQHGNGGWYDLYLAFDAYDEATYE